MTTSRSFWLVTTLAFGAWLVLASAARADLKLCNRTNSTVGVALGYKNDKGWWTSEGWWNVPPKQCKILLQGDLIARYYYIFAIDYDKGGTWTGPATLCIQDKIFTIRGRTNCEARGYRTQGFYEVDTGEQRDFTIMLTDDSKHHKKRK